MAARTPTAEPTEYDRLETHIVALQEQRRTLLAEQISLERQNVVPTEPKPTETSTATRIARWMNGFSSAHLVGANRGERLYEIIQDMTAIEAAVAELERRRLRLEGERTAVEAQAMQPAWRALVADIIVTAERLRHLEQQAADVPMLIRQLLPLGYLGVRSAVGANWSADPIGRARRDALAAGIITERDIQGAGR